MKLAFIRSIDVQQMTPYLSQLESVFAQHDIQAKIFYTDGHCSPEDFPGEAEKLAPSIGAGELASLVGAWRPDAVVSLSIPDENTLRDAIVKKALASSGVEMIIHDADAACLFANKWDTKQLLSRFGLSTSPGFIVDGDLLNGRAISAPAYIELIKSRSLEIGYPFVCKPLWECLGNGIRYINSEADWDDYISNPYDGNILIEKCLIGDLVSIEIVGRSGDYVFQPSIWKGQSSPRPRLAFTRVMHNPCDVEAAAALGVAKGKLLDLCRHLDLCGAIEVEMIFVDGTFYILEINPRVSGSTSLFVASSGFNTYTALTNIAIGRWPTFSKTFQGRTAFALQFPYDRGTRSPVASDSDDVDIIRASTFVIDGIERPNAIISCPQHHILSVPAWIDRHFDVNPVIGDEIASVCARTAVDWDRLAEAEFPK